MIRLITFATDDFTISADRLKATALRYGVNEVQIWTSANIELDLLYWIIKPLIINSRGYGWWMWKSWVMMNAITAPSLKDGDILIYCDAGTELVDSVNHVINQMDEDIFLFSNGWQHSHWCKKEVAMAMVPGAFIYPEKELKYPNNFYTHKQIQASAIFFKVNDNTRKLVQEWYAWSIMPGMIDNTPRGPQFPEFQEHRHDQAILTCLQIKYGYKLHWFPATMNHHNDKMGDPYPQIFNHHRKRNNEW